MPPFIDANELPLSGLDVTLCLFAQSGSVNPSSNNCKSSPKTSHVVKASDVLCNNQLQMIELSMQPKMAVEIIQI